MFAKTFRRAAGVLVASLERMFRRGQQRTSLAGSLGRARARPTDAAMVGRRGKRIRTFASWGRLRNRLAVVTSTSGDVIGEFEAPCSSFSTTVSTLFPGTYRATARLLDGGEARTTAVPIDDSDRGEFESGRGHRLSSRYLLLNLS